MSGFPSVIAPPIVTTFDAWRSVGPTATAMGGASGSASAWLSANTAMYIPFTLEQSMTVCKLFGANSSITGNNFDIGIYDKEGNKIVSTGSTAQSGSSLTQFVDVTDVTIGPGLFYFGVVMNGTSGGFWRMNAILSNENMLGVFSQSTAFPLPTTATFATAISGYIPLVGFTTNPKIL